jgi:hypothetical protein
MIPGRRRRPERLNKLVNHVLPVTDPGPGNREHSRASLASAGPRLPSRGGPPTGTAVVVGVILLAATLGGFAVWFQWGQTRRCLGFFGPEITRQIQSAAGVELWFLEPGSSGPMVVRRQDVTRAAGLVHLRRGLIEDVNYRWPNEGWPDEKGPAPARRDRLPPAAWDVALAFFTNGVADAPTAKPSVPPAAVLAIDLDEPGSLTVVGRPGRVALGRLGPGLQRWVEATKKDGFSGEKSAY